MQSLTTSNPPSFSLWGMKPGSLALTAMILVVALAAFVGSHPSQAQGEASHRLQKLAGAWSVQTTLENQQTTFPSLLTFTSDGIVLADEPPNPFETTAHGNWVATGPGEAAFTFLALIGGGAGIDLALTIKVVAKLQYDAHADNWAGVFKVRLTDPDGNEVFADRGTFKGTRIPIETLD